MVGFFGYNRRFWDVGRVIGIVIRVVRSVSFFGCRGILVEDVV